MNNDVVSAERKSYSEENKRLEPTVLATGGALLLGLAAFFLWQEMNLTSAVLAVGGSVCAAGLAFYAHRKGLTLVGPFFLAVVSVGSGAWYAATKEPILLGALAISFVASVVLTWALSHERIADSQLHHTVAWLGTAVSGLIGSFALYFEVFDASELHLQGFSGRRFVLTLAWLLGGVLMVTVGRKRNLIEARDAGFLVLAASMGKLLFYDVAHTDGLLRVAGLTLGGVVLVAASQFINRLSSRGGK